MKQLKNSCRNVLILMAIVIALVVAFENFKLLIDHSYLLLLLLPAVLAKLLLLPTVVRFMTGAKKGQAPEKSSDAYFTLVNALVIALAGFMVVISLCQYKRGKLEQNALNVMGNLDAATVAAIEAEIYSMRQNQSTFLSRHFEPREQTSISHVQMNQLEYNGISIGAVLNYFDWVPNSVTINYQKINDTLVLPTVIPQAARFCALSNS